jgi:hypothetical protein
MDDHDPCDDLLSVRPLPENTVLRQALLARTTTLLRRRRLRRWARTAALAACGALGLLTLQRERTPAPALPVARRPPQPAPPVAPPEAAPTALALEWQALDKPGPQPRLYRQAGDRYLREDADVESALRCYGQALNQGTADDLRIAPEDNWLLIAIKDARQREKRDAKNDG